MRIATFNVQNLRLRDGPGGAHLDGALDRDVNLPADARLDLRDRRLTAEVIARIAPDVLCLQEVFDVATLDFFHDMFLLGAGCRPMASRICIKGNDGHGLNVAVMARLPPDEVTSHAEVTADDLGLPDNDDLLHGGSIFRRDCLQVRFGELTLFVCHLKAPYPDRARALAIRSLEACAIRRIVETAFETPAEALWMILGDLNMPTRPGNGGDPGLSVLHDGFSVDLLQRRPAGDDWTFRMPDTGERLRPDAMLASPALARLADGCVPGIERSGMEIAPGLERPHASDHAAVWLDLPDLAATRGA